MSRLHELRDRSLAGAWGRERQAWANAWLEAEQRLPDGESALDVISASEWSNWNGIIADGDRLWGGKLLLTEQRFIQISLDGLGQIPLRELSGASYSEFRSGLFKRYPHLILTSGTRVAHAFALWGKVSLTRQFALAVETVFAGRPIEKFE